MAKTTHGISEWEQGGSKNVQIFINSLIGGIETGSMYVHYVQGF